METKANGDQPNLGWSDEEVAQAAESVASESPGAVEEQAPPAPERPAPRAADERMSPEAAERAAAAIYQRPLMELAANLPVKSGQGIVVSNYLESWTVARIVHTSGLAPKGMNISQLAVAIIHGGDLGLTPMVAAQNVAVVNGRPTVFGKAALALVRQHPEFVGMREWFELDGMEWDAARGEAALPLNLNEWPTDLTAFCCITRRDQEPVIRSFSVAQAMRAKLWNKQGKTGGATPWFSYPTRMLAWKPRNHAMYDVFPEALLGLPVFEDVQEAYEKEEPRDVTAEVEVKGQFGSPVDFNESDVEPVEKEGESGVG